MKRNLLFLGLIISSIIVHAQQQKANNKFTLKGKVIGRDTGFICLSYLNENYKPVRDTTYLKNGFFAFTGAISEPHFAGLIGNSQPLSSDNKNFTIFI